MSSLYNKYRPRTFDEMIGNEVAIKALQNNLKKKVHSHVYLFTGPSGCGKTTASRIMARLLGAEELDIREINIGSNRGIDTAREIIQSIRVLPLSGKSIVYIMDECDSFTPDMQKALKKPLEDTPNHVYFFLCTTKPEKIIPEIKTRCEKVQFSSLKPKELFELIKKVNKEEELEVSNEILEEISESCDGSAREALVLLGKVSGVSTEKEALKIIKNSSIDENDTEIIELARALLNENNGWSVIAKILKGLQENGKLDNPETVRYIILGYMNSVLLSGKLNNRAIGALEAFSENTFSVGKAGITLACLNTIS